MEKVRETESDEDMERGREKEVIKRVMKTCEEGGKRE